MISMNIGIDDKGKRESLREFVMRNARESKEMVSWKKKGFEERLKVADKIGKK